MSALPRGPVSGSYGMDMVRREEAIRRLQEFGCNVRRYDPYADGPDPKFREEGALWF